MLYPQLRREYPVAVRAQGSFVWDEQGRSYLDGSSGAIVVNLGHGVPEVVEAVKAQLDEITYVSRLQFTNPWAEALADELVALAPAGLERVLFTNSGSEAIEAAVRLAVQYWQEVGQPQRSVLISRDGSYHGATLAAIGLSGHPARRRPVEALLPDWPRASAANCSDCPFGKTRSTCALDCAASIEQAIESEGPGRVAAVVLEPVVGASGGAVPAPDGYLREVERICREHDVLLIADEVITGLGRTGSWFGCDEENVRPDLLALGKGVSGGYAPLGAVLVSGRLYDGIDANSGQFPLGHTYSANPLATATGLAVLRYARAHDLAARARELGATLARRLRQALADRGVVADVRGRGLLLAVDFSRPDETAGPTAADVVAAAARNGLLLYPAGTSAVARVVVVAPPLTITNGELDELIARFGGALDDLHTPVHPSSHHLLEGAVR